MVLDSVRLSLGTFTILPVRPPGRISRTISGRAMAIAPFIGASLGVVAAAVGGIVDRGWNSPLLAAVAAVATLAVLTRAIHLDGLADTADGLGSSKRGVEAVEIMRRSDIGPFGVVTLLLVLVADMVLISRLISQGQLLQLAIATCIGRFAVAVLCTRRFQPASKTGLGAVVATTVHPLLLTIVALFVIAVSAVAGWRGIGALGVATVAVLVLGIRCVRRFNGITGDVLGASVEVATLACLVMLTIPTN